MLPPAVERLSRSTGPTPSPNASACRIASVTNIFSARTASSSGTPRGEVGDDRGAEGVHPVPCVFAVSIRSATTHSSRAPSANRSAASPGDPARWPPFTSTAWGPSQRFPQRRAACPSRVSTANPARVDASGRFGVTSVASGRTHVRSAATASAESRA